MNETIIINFQTGDTTTKIKLNLSEANELQELLNVFLLNEVNVHCTGINVINKDFKGLC